MNRGVSRDRAGISSPCMGPLPRVSAIEMIPAATAWWHATGLDQSTDGTGVRHCVQMADTKLTGLVGEHWVSAVMAGHGWAVALTRDGLEHTDILGVHSSTRWLVEVQVKTASHGRSPNWPLNLKAQESAKTDREWFVLVALASSPAGTHRAFVVPRDHVAAAAWISHMSWLTEPSIEPGKRNAGVNLARVKSEVFAGYEDRWDLLGHPTTEAPVLLPESYRALALEERVGLPPQHPWQSGLPAWTTDSGASVASGTRKTQ